MFMISELSNANWFFVSITFYKAKSIKIQDIIEDIKLIIEEIKLQNEYANNEPQLAPKIYFVTIQYGNEFIKRYAEPANLPKLFCLLKSLYNCLWKYGVFKILNVFPDMLNLLLNIFET